jgi:hypothetical protein
VPVYLIWSRGARGLLLLLVHGAVVAGLFIAVVVARIFVASVAGGS